MGKEKKEDLSNKMIIAGSIDSVGIDPMEISDGYHTFQELYDQRRTLFYVVCKLLEDQGYEVYKTKLHHDGTMFDGHFMVCVESVDGDMTFHFEERHWDFFKDIPEVERAQKPFDGHTPKDVMDRLIRVVNIIPQ